MDPQQRLLLEAGYEAMHGTTLRRSELRSRDVGIFIGLSVSAPRISACSAQK
jgi:acyl transferase domain-containing protein